MRLKNISLFCLVLLTAGLSSCSLDEKPRAYAAREELFASEDGLRSYSLSFYKALPTLKSIPICEASTVDYAACRSFSNYYSLNAYTAETSTSWSWSDLRNINYFLDALSSKDCTVDAEVKAHYEGVARWFRAWFYYDKLTTYGPVPWFAHCLSNTDIDEMYRARDSRDCIIGHIIEDLDFAYAHITTEESAGNTLISKYAALALKSRACLFEASYRRYHGESGTAYTAKKLYELCRDASQTLVNSKKFSLNTTVVQDNYMVTKGAYRSLFYSRDVLTNEVILGCAASDAEAVRGEANWRFNSGSYGNGYCLSRAFVQTYLKKNGEAYTDQATYSLLTFKEEFNDRDPRLEQTVMGPSYGMITSGKPAHKVPDIVNTVAPTGYHPIKFVEDHTGKDNTNKNENSYPIIRYAEILLNLAEAKAELASLTDTDWKNTVGALRIRAGINNGVNAVIKVPTSVDPYLQATFYPKVSNAAILEIRRERAIELVYEGFRVNDLRRWAEGKRFEKVPWTGIHFDALDTPFDLDEDGAYDYYFSEKEITKIPAKYRSIYVQLLPADSDKQGLRADANAGGGYDLRYELDLKRKWYDDGRQYLNPIPAQIVRDYANRGYSISQNPGW